MHLAAYYDFSGAASPLYQEVTIDGTARLLGRLQAFDVDQFVFPSTMLVHAPAVPGQRITEDSPLAPTWAYPASTVATERVIAERRGDIPAVLLRIAGGTGLSTAVDVLAGIALIASPCGVDRSANATDRRSPSVKSDEHAPQHRRGQRSSSRRTSSGRMTSPVPAGWNA